MSLDEEVVFCADDPVFLYLLSWKDMRHPRKKLFETTIKIT
jgi:hypothetical protein